ncbi:cytochrome c oxidase assembly protein [Streptomyces griseorubiginosus]|uniref:cytochrome c oxidase assembly protein n=1 Tax=Streptomyces griseorubiginosus TaxID=67304 RepID=UPI00215A6111|nr:cytochrome c oxidase assembly protein [Streptomyces griseorubiginosus]
MGPGPAELVIAGVALLVSAACLTAAGRLRGRGDAWPRAWDATFAAGGLGVVWATLGHLWGGPFTQHVVRHLVLGMAAPLLFVAARPVTLAPRALAPGRPRRRLVALAQHVNDAGIRRRRRMVGPARALGDRERLR